MAPSYTLIVGAAPVPGEERVYRRIVNAAPRVIAADGGLMVCLDAGRVPEAVIGDFDSVGDDLLERAAAAGARILRYPVEKDESDLDLALAYARAEGSTEVRFTAAFSGRLDHTLAALGTLLRSADLDGRLEEPGLDGFVLDSNHRSSLVLDAVPGQVLSVFVLDDRTVLSLRGVRYPLDSRRLSTLSSLGLSNIAVDPEQEITVQHGAVIVIIARRSLQ